MGVTPYEQDHKKFVTGQAKSDKKIYPMLYDHDKLGAHVEKRLKEVKVLQGPENLPNSDPSNCLKLSDHQLIKIIWLLDSLELDDEFKGSVAREMDVDFEDKNAAHGGVIVLKEGKLNLNPIQSTPTKEGILDGKKNYENYFYNPVDFSISPDCMFLYHFHAYEEDNSRYASPTNSDLKEAERRKVDGVLFTKILGKHFNADFYAVGRDENNRPFHIVLDLGLYEY